MSEGLRRNVVFGKRRKSFGGCIYFYMSDGFVYFELLFYIELLF